jgi:hypothetical protein
MNLPALSQTHANETSACRNICLAGLLQKGIPLSHLDMRRIELSPMGENGNTKKERRGGGHIETGHRQVRRHPLPISPVEFDFAIHVRVTVDC